MALGSRARPAILSCTALLAISVAAVGPTSVGPLRASDIRVAMSSHHLIAPRLQPAHLGEASYQTRSSRFGFDQPASTASDGTHLWVLNEGVDTLSEISDSNDALLRTIDVPSIGYDVWARLASSKNALWVLNTKGITEIAKATGRIVKTIPETDGEELYSDGTHLWAALHASVVEVDESSGVVVQVFASSRYHFDDIQSLIAVGWHLWVASYAYDPFGPSSGSIVEIDIQTGRVIRILGTLDIQYPLGIASDGSHLWVAQFGAPSMELNQDSGALIRSLPSAWAVTYGGGHVWFTSQTANALVTEVNPANGKVVHSLSSGFNWPYAITADGTHVWVPNFYGNSVTEVSESSRSIVRVLTNPPYGFNDPSPIAFEGGHLWVANATSLTETSATGTLLRTVELPDGSNGSAGTLVADDSHLWLIDANNSLSEFDASNGALVQVLSSPSFGFDEPLGIAADGTLLWVTNFGNDTVTELNQSDGSLVQVLSGASYGFDAPFAITADGTHVWVINDGNGSVTELDQASGAADRVVTAAAGGFEDPDAVVADGTHSWVLNLTGSISELTAAGTLVKVLSGAKFGFDNPQTLLADGLGHLWVASYGSTVTEVAETTGEPLRVVSDGVEEYSGARAESLAVGAESLWVADSANDAVAQLSDSTGHVVQVLVGATSTIP